MNLALSSLSVFQISHLPVSQGQLPTGQFEQNREEIFKHPCVPRFVQETCQSAEREQWSGSAEVLTETGWGRGDDRLRDETTSADSGGVSEAGKMGSADFAMGI